MSDSLSPSTLLLLQPPVHPNVPASDFLSNASAWGKALLNTSDKPKFKEALMLIISSNPSEVV